MFKHLSVYDVPVLLSLGFTYGWSGATLWGQTKDGEVYQVVEDGEWLRFGKQRANGGVDPNSRMTHTKFNELFRV